MAQIVLRPGKPPFGGPAEPPGRFRIVGRHPFAREIGEAQIVLGGRVSLRRRLAEPFQRFGIVGGNAPAPEICGAEIVLCNRVPLFRGLAEPLNRFRMIGRDTETPAVQDT